MNKISDWHKKKKSTNMVYTASIDGKNNYNYSKTPC